MWMVLHVRNHIPHFFCCDSAFCTKQKMRIFATLYNAFSHLSIIANYFTVIEMRKMSKAAVNFSPP